MARTSNFKNRLTSALRAALDELRQRIGSERLYGFVLYTSGEDDFVYVSASANTEEALGDDRDLRWSVADWKYHDFSKTIGSLELPDGEGEARDQRVYRDMIAALKTLDEEHRFGQGAAREQIVLNVVCGDMSEEFFTAGLRQLNPVTVVDAWLEAKTTWPQRPPS